jgi:hypothetical protein
METTQVITITTYLLFIYLILALFVERSVEIIVSIFNYADLKLGWYATWNRMARKYQKRFDRLYSYKGSESSQVDRVLNWVLWRIVTDKPYPGGKDVILASSVRLNFVRLMSRIAAFLISLIFVIIIYVKLKVDLVSVMGNIVGDSKILGLLENHNILRIGISAVAISLGSEPLHQAIKGIESIGKKKSTVKK